MPHPPQSPKTQTPRSLPTPSRSYFIALVTAQQECQLLYPFTYSLICLLSKHIAARSALCPKEWAVPLPRARPMELAIHRDPDTHRRTKSKRREIAQSRRRALLAASQQAMTSAQVQGPLQDLRRRAFLQQNGKRVLPPLPSMVDHKPAMQREAISNHEATPEMQQKNQPFLTSSIWSLLTLCVPTDTPTS